MPDMRTNISMLDLSDLNDSGLFPLRQDCKSSDPALHKALISHGLYRLGGTTARRMEIFVRMCEDAFVETGRALDQKEKRSNSSESLERFSPLRTRPGPWHFPFAPHSGAGFPARP